MSPVFLLGMGAPPLFVSLGAGYLALGSATAALLAKRGRPAATVGTAILAWPVLLPLAFGDEPKAPSGPHGHRIDASLQALGEALSETPANGPGWTEDVTGLRAALHRADARVGMVDRLIEQAPSSLEDPDTLASLDALRSAREQSVREIEAVLLGVVQLRLQVGLLTLAG